MPVYRDRYGKLAHRPGARSRSWDYKPFLIAIAVVLAVVIAIFWSVAYFGSRTTVENCTVTSKDRGVSFTSDGDGNVTSQTNYRVYSDCGTFTVEDNLFLGKFNSADTYGAIEDGQTYDFDVIGWRNGFFSMFPNILETTVR